MPFFSNNPASLVIQKGACEPAMALQPRVSLSSEAAVDCVAGEEVRLKRQGELSQHSRANQFLLAILATIGLSPLNASYEFNLTLNSIELKLLRRRLPLVDVDFPAFGLRQIQGIAFDIAKAQFSIEAV